MTNPEIYQKTYIASATTTQVFTGTGVLKAIVVNAPAGTIGIIDGTAGTTVNVGQIAATGVGTYEYDITIANGLRIVTGGATDITVVWAK